MAGCQSAGAPGKADKPCPPGSSGRELYIGCPPAVFMACLERCEPAASRVEQEGDRKPDQIDGAQVEPPPGRKSVERCQERHDATVHQEGENDDQSVYDIEMEQVEEEGNASKDDKKA